MIPEIYDRFGRVFSRQRIRKIEDYLRSAGMDVPPESFAGFVLILSVLISIALFFFISGYALVENAYIALFSSLIDPYLALSLKLIFSVLIGFGATWFLVWIYLLFRIDARKRSVESVLPDLLTLMAGNVRSGMNVDQAMWYAAKPEFGMVSEEIRKVIKTSFAGKSFESALDDLAERFNSRIFIRTVNLIKQAMATGGEVAKVLEETAEDAREIALQKKDINSTLLIYIIFVVFAAGIGTPLLFSISNKLILVLFMAFSQIPQGVQASDMGFFIQPSTPFITTTQFFYFSMATIFITALFSSLIIGIIKTGSKLQGLKYFPLMLILGYVIYFVVDSIMQSYFASILI